jgi:hypothetical protein
VRDKDQVREDSQKLWVLGIKSDLVARSQWLTPIILTTWEAEIGRIKV